MHNPAWIADMTAWLEDVLAFGKAIRGHGDMAGRTGANCRADKALGIYRNNCRGNLQGALELAYPVIGQLVGEAFFRMMAMMYIESHPSKSGNLHDYGSALGEFLASFPNARELPYLAEIAKLEWACHRAYFAPDAEPIDLAALAGVARENQGGLRFQLHPACRMVRSSFPIVEIWQAHQPGAPEDFRIDLDSGPQIALVNRKHDAVRVEALSNPASAWLEAIHSGATLWDATSAVLENHPGFDLASHLADWIQREVLVDSDHEAKEH